jgi:hypothetical protein
LLHKENVWFSQAMSATLSILLCWRYMSGKPAAARLDHPQFLLVLCMAFEKLSPEQKFVANVNVGPNNGDPFPKTSEGQ